MKCCLTVAALFLTSIALQAQAQIAPPSNGSPAKPAVQPKLAIQAEALPSVATPSPDETPLTPAPKGIIVGGPLIDLFKSPETRPSNDPEGPPAPIVGLNLVNPFAPKPPSNQQTTDWTGKRPRDQRSLKPKKAQFLGINLFSIKF